MRPFWWASLLTAILVSPQPVAAHDFWLAADRYQLRPGEETVVRFLVGDGADLETWPFRPERVVSLQDIGPAGVSDLQSVAGQPLRLRLSDEGSHLVAFASTPSPSELDAAQFAAYLEEEGLVAVAADRRARGTESAPGRELYARRAKAVLQVGPRLTGNVLQPVGQSLEIVPLSHPLAARSGPLGFRILFRGRPLAGARAACRRLDRSGPAERVQTDRDGHAVCTIARQGAWIIATAWSVPIAGNKLADYDTLFASLTFGY